MNDINYKLKKPYFKKRSYISELKEKINIDINDIKINYFNKISNKSNALKLNMYINDENINIIENIDNNFLSILKKKNKLWFNNNLDDNDLTELFNYSICSQTKTIEAILSNNSEIIYNNKNIELNNELNTILKNNKVNYDITLNCLGLYIFKEKIQTKWFIKKIEITDYSIINDFLINKIEIEDEWENTLNETISNLNELLSIYEINKIKINNFISINKNLIIEIKNIKNNDKTWNNKINILKNNIKNILSINDNR